MPLWNNGFPGRRPMIDIESCILRHLYLRVVERLTVVLLHRSVDEDGEDGNRGGEWHPCEDGARNEAHGAMIHLDLFARKHCAHGNKRGTLSSCYRSSTSAFSMLARVYESRGRKKQILGCIYSVLEL